MIPLDYSVLKGVFQKSWGSDLNIYLTFQNSIVSGSASNLAVNTGNILLYCLYDDIPTNVPLYKDIMSRYNLGYEHKYLQVQNFTNTQTYAPSTTYKIQLNNLNGNCAYMWWVLRSSKSPTSNGWTTYQKIGDNVAQGNYQLLDPSQIQIYNNNLDAGGLEGTFEPAAHFKNLLARYQKGIYRFFISEPTDFWNDEEGRVAFKNVLPMQGNYYLQFTTAANNAETARVITITTEFPELLELRKPLLELIK